MIGDVIRSDEDRKAITSYLTEELNTILDGADRERLEKKWDKWRRQAQARPEQETKSFPWDKASNVMPPLTATNTNGIYASLKSTFGQRRPFWDCSTNDPKLSDGAKALGSMLDVLTESSQHLNLRRMNNTIFYDLSLMGNKFVKIPWDINYWSFKRKDAFGNLVQVSKKIHDSPSIFPIRMEDYFQPLYIDDPQRAPWTAVRYHYTWAELLQRQQQGVFSNVEDIIKRGGDDIPENYKREMSRQGMTFDEHRRPESSIYDLFASNVYWDVDGDGVPEDIVLYFEDRKSVV